MTAKNYLRLLVCSIVILLSVLLISCRNNSGTPSIDRFETRPAITALSHNAAAVGDRLTIQGTGFGISQGSGRVSLNGMDFLINSWSDTRLVITVVEGMTTGTIVVTCYCLTSEPVDQALLVITDPGQTTLELSITNVIPDHAAIGATVRIVGEGFGPTQADSTLEVNETSVSDVVTWGSSQIDFIVPADATSGNLILTVADDIATYPDFTVDQAPVISDIEPQAMAIGEAVTINGECFGDTQGTGSLQIAGEVIPVDQWQDDQLIVDALPEIAPVDIMAVPVIVTTDGGLSSETVYGRLLSELDCVITVEPSVGEANRPDQQGDNGDGTEFSFAVDVMGGSGNYTFRLLEHWDDMTSHQPATAESPVRHLFDQPGDYLTGMEVLDNVTGDTQLIEGPEITVVAWDEPLITTIGVSSFNNSNFAGPNDLSYYPGIDGNPHYYDLVLDNGVPVFTSDFVDVEIDGTPEAGVTRDLGSYFFDGSNPRPVAYRYQAGFNSHVGLVGLNFGNSKGSLYLRSNGPDDAEHYLLPATDIIVWEDGFIEFRLPANVNESLSGHIVIVPMTTDKWTRSDQPLICSPYFDLVGPATLNLDSEITITGYDLLPPVAAGLTGSKTYLIWWVNATFSNEFIDGAESSQKVCAVVPVEVIAGETTFSFNMAELGLTQQIEYFNADLTDSLLGMGQLNSPSIPTPYSLFLWTGAMDPTEVGLQEFAHSGVFSEGREVLVGGGNIAPHAVLAADVTSGAAPLTVNFDLAGSLDPDGAIAKFEFDDGDPANGKDWLDLGAIPSPQTVTYDTDGFYTAQLRVTDEGDSSDIDEVLIMVGDLPTMFAFEIGCAELAEDGGPIGSPLPEVKAWRAGTEYMSFDVTHDSMGLLGTVVCDELGMYQGLYEVNVGSMQVPEGIITITANRPPIKNWIKPMTGFPLIKVIYEDNTLANGQMLYVIDEGEFNAVQ